MKPRPAAARAVFLRILLLLLVAMGIFAGIVGCMQRRMIFHPRPYSQDLLSAMPERLVQIPYEVAGKPQVAYYLPPEQQPAEGEATPIWVLFHGNASVALWWVRWIEEDLGDTDHVGWLLVDYPGYGLNEGAPTRSSIVQAVEVVIPELAAELGVPKESIEEDLNTLGFSLGAAAAMEFAVRHPVRHVVLLAPFTSLEAMARRSVGWPLSELLIDRFDNSVRLAELAETNPAARVVVIHGDRDSVVPLSQGRELADQFPDMVRFVPVPGGDHVDILDPAAEVLREILNDGTPVP